MNEFLFCSSIPQSSVFTFRLSENDEVCSNIRSLVHLLRNSHASVGLPPVWWAIIIIVATSEELSLSYFHDDHFPCLHSQPSFSVKCLQTKFMKDVNADDYPMAKWPAPSPILRRQEKEQLLQFPQHFLFVKQSVLDVTSK